MSSQSLCLQVCVVCLIICLTTSSPSHAQDSMLSRVKRGFRINSASRVAHGYGKRGYVGRVEDFAPFSADQLEAEPDVLDSKEEDWTLLSVDELASLLQNHPKLAKSIVKKLLDLNNDGMISADELFRPAK